MVNVSLQRLTEEGVCKLNLSMWIIADELSKLDPTCDITDGNMSIAYYRLLSGEKSSQDGYVNISIDYNSAGNGTGTVVLTHSVDVITLEQVHVEGTINTIIKIFDKYRLWNLRLIEESKGPANFQAVLDVAHEMLQCPMFFGNVSLHIYAITKQYDKAEVFEEWDDVKLLKTMPVSLLEKLQIFDLPTQFVEAQEPAILPALPGAKNKHRIRFGCYLDDALWGHLLLYYMDSTINTSVLQLARHVTDVFGQMIKENGDAGLQYNSRFSWLIDLLDGQEVSDEPLTTIYRQLKWEHSDTLLLYKIEPSKSKSDKSMRFWIADSMSDIPGIIVFTHGSAVIVIVRREDSSAQQATDRIIRLIGRGDYHCGTGFPFKGLKNISIYSRQASYAIEYAQCSWDKIHLFNDCALRGVAVELKSHTQWRSWIAPSLLDLIEHDDTQGTNYYATLFYFLVNKGHIANTAKELFVHRNTLLYRLDKLEQMLDVDLQEESVLSYLRFCFSMLAEDYPQPYTKLKRDASR